MKANGTESGGGGKGERRGGLARLIRERVHDEDDGLGFLFSIPPPTLTPSSSSSDKYGLKSTLPLSLSLKLPVPETGTSGRTKLSLLFCLSRAGTKSLGLKWGCGEDCIA